MDGYQVTDMSYTLVDNTVQIDLNRHALIEASAGTGKTYTIENLVVRLLKERHDVALENILIVTFTEKATSELKIRIREKLEQELSVSADHSEVLQKIKDTLDSFDAASIYTIHGFCHTILKDFAFENGTLFRNEVIDDKPLFDTLLKEQMRKVWPEIYQEYFLEMLNISGLSTRKDRLLTLIVDIARRIYRPSVGDEIQPDPEGKNISQIRSEIKTLLMQLKTLIGIPPEFSQGFDRLNIHGVSKKSLLEKIVMPLETYLAQIDENNFIMAHFSELIEQIQQTKSAGRQGSECLIPDKWLKKGANPEVCPNLEAVVEKLESLIQAHQILVHFLTVSAIKQLQKDAAVIKRQNGWISYDDMLGQVESSLYGNNSAALLKKLRGKYRVAFVDEFQDTDPVQWRIFRKIFLDHAAEHSENLLYLIGDPKQAIYSFRGADVYAYLDARNEIQRLSTSGRANLYSLATNWRSRPELVQTFNDLFCRKEWFPPHHQAGTFEIGYQAAGSPGEDDLPAVLVADNSHRSALTVVDLRGPKSPKAAKPDLARFIASEIEYLATGGRIEIQGKNSDRRPLDFGDICILVRGRPDTLFLEPELIDRKIPYTFYKKSGLFLSDEAIYLSLVLHAVFDPGNIPDVKKALLTPFFEYKPKNLYDYENLPVSHPLKQLLFQWNDQARSRKWSLLFQSLMEDSGLLFREAESRDWDRKYTNYRQIFEHLEIVAYQKKLDFRGLSALLDSYRKQTVGTDDDADIHQIETEDRKVQIMTMHVSKGLQFPVVFIAGGLTQPFRDDHHVYHVYDEDNPTAGIRKVIDLSKQSAKEQHNREKTNEDKRLFYVALSRAQFKLYVPFFPFTSRQAWVGPVCRLLSPALASAFLEDDDNPAVGWLAPDAHSAPGERDVKTVKQAIISEKDIDKFPWILPSINNYQHRKIILKSFSSLHNSIFHGLDQLPHDIRFQTALEKDKEDDESFASFDSANIQSIRAADEIPGGTDIGLMFHDIIEHIDFKAVVENPGGFSESPETRDVIVKYMEIYRINERWRPQVCQIIADVLTTPVSVAGDKLIIGHLRKKDRIHEVEFYYPFSLPVDKELKIADCEIQRGHNGFIRGFVDLVFRYKGKFFIADWKSNRIDAGYDLEALESNMNNAGYHLQYKLYTIAVLRWLTQSLGNRFDPDKQFGGIFYFYLRGMGSGNGNGIYYVAPGNIGRLEHLEEEIANQIAGTI